MAFHPNAQQQLITAADFDPISSLRKALAPKARPWDSIVDFATHPSFCGMRLYPRQLTMLKLIFLETENMTGYDLDVIEDWRQGFVRQRDVYGVQPDIWERIEYLKSRGARRFPHIQYVGGRRGGKGLIGGILGAEQVAYFHSLGDFQAHYGVDPGKTAYMQIGATSQTQAKQQLYADVRSTISRCKYLQPHIAEAKDYILSVRTEADVARIAEMKAANMPIEHLVASLRVQALSASAAAGRGAAAFGIMLDEFAFFLETDSGKSGSAIYEDWTPSLDQFGIDALCYIPSSPYTKAGRFYGLYQQGSVLMSSYNDTEGVSERAQEAYTGDAELNADPTMLILHLPSWSAYQDWERGPELIRRKFKGPIQPGPDHESQVRRKLRNPDKFAVERAAQWADVMGAYLDPGKVDKIFRTPSWRAEPLEPQSRGYLYRKYRIHCDPSKTGANFAMCVGHLEEYCQTCNWAPQRDTDVHPPCAEHKMRPHVVIDLLHVWKPSDFPEDPETGKPTIDYLQVSSEIAGILRSFPSTSKITFDQYSSIGDIQALRKEFSPNIRVGEVTFTEKENQARFEKLKAAIYMEMVSSYKDTFFGDGQSLLEHELKFLSVKAGRVVKQDVGPVTTKDLADALMVVVTDLLHDVLERYGPGDNMATASYGSSNVMGLRTGRDLERMGAPNKARQAIAELSAGNHRGGYGPSRAASIHARRNSRRY